MALKIMNRPVAPIHLYCPACRQARDPSGGLFGCPGADNRREHIFQKKWTGAFNRARARETVLTRWQKDGRDPFFIFQPLMAAGNLPDAESYRRHLDSIQNRLREIEKHPFTVTPLFPAAALADAIGFSGRLWIKDETGNITGSHKGRHLMGSLLYIEGIRAQTRRQTKQVLAIYSCGNAALAASAVARAGGYELHAFVPDSVDESVVEMLNDRGAVVEIISRLAGSTGDPCYLAFRRAVDEKKWIPFSCSGNDNWSNIEGGETLGAETALQLGDHTAEVSHLVIQVGGGALARAIAGGWESLNRLGIGARLPKISVCQPEGNYPFIRAYYLALAKIARTNQLAFDLHPAPDDVPAAALEKIRRFADRHPAQVTDVAEFARHNFQAPAVQTPLAEIVADTGQYMWAWDGPVPASLAHGILDDVTYDWYYLLRSIIKSGGRAVVVPEDTIRNAWRLAREQTDITVSATGCAGLAGLIELIKTGAIAPTENVGLFFTGIDRQGGKYV